MIQVMIIESSQTNQQLMKRILEKSPEIVITAMFSNAEEAIISLKNHKPDIIAMDIDLPGMNGLEATAYIMETDPIPIILLSNEDKTAYTSAAFDALKYGALTVLKKTPALNHPTFESYSKNFIFQIKALSDVKLITRKKRAKDIQGMLPSASRTLHSKRPLVAIGASTGGPPVLHEIFHSLNQDFSFPILFVQHISTGFISGLTDWLNNNTKLTVEIAQNGQRPNPGHIYAAPDDFHMTIDIYGKILLKKDPVCKRPRPSISTFFSSVAQVQSSSAIGILLTGMGKDGADELKEMKKKGALTIAQSEETCGVFGMPKAAIERGGATMILSPFEIATTLNNISDEYRRESAPKVNLPSLFQRLSKVEDL